MNTDITISFTEFKNINNGLCDLDEVTRQLEDVLNAELYKKLAGAASEIRRGLRSAYEQDRKAHEQKCDHYNRIQDELGLKAIWSVYEVDNLSDPHPFKGVENLLYKDHWGIKPITKKINGLTWAALYVAADAAIRDSDDSHHIFIESFLPAKNDSKTLIMLTGS